MAKVLAADRTHIYICGLQGMEEGVEKAVISIGESIGQPGTTQRDAMREDGQYHLETY